MQKVTEITCVCCPNACQVRVDETNGNAVSGNRCRNGEAYAIHELNNPKRLITAEVRISGALVDRCPVKTDRAVPRETLSNIARALEELRVEAPVYVSQVLVRDIAGTGANLVACKTISQISNERQDG